MTSYTVDICSHTISKKLVQNRSIIARNLSVSLLPGVIKVHSRHPLEHKLELNFLLRGWSRRLAVSAQRGNRLYLLQFTDECFGMVPDSGCGGVLRQWVPTFLAAPFLLRTPSEINNEGQGPAQTNAEEPRHAAAHSTPL